MSFRRFAESLFGLLLRNLAGEQIEKKTIISVSDS